jgi:hypothetical protein
MKQDFRAVQEQRDAQLAGKINDLRTALQGRDPNLIAAQSGSSYDFAREEFHILLMGRDCVLTGPRLEGHFDSGEPLPAIYSALLLYYLTTSDGFPLTHSWVSFGDLPGGRTYNQAFQGYTGNEISKVFGLDLVAFKSACEKAAGEFIALGDAAYCFQVLPRIPVLVVYHLGDEDFPSTCKILFDSSATHYVPIDACAVMGSMLAQKIIKTTTLHFLQPKP